MTSHRNEADAIEQMNAARRIVLHSLHGYQPELEPLVTDWIRDGVKYVGLSSATDLVCNVTGGHGVTALDPAAEPRAIVP